MPMNNSGIDRRVLRSKEAFKNALLDLMLRKSFASISITEIVEHANYNRGTFYAHYENKEALLNEIMAELIEEMLEAFRAPYNQVDLFRIDEMPAHAIKLFEHIYERAAIYRILFQSDVLSVIKEQMYAAIRKITVEELEHTNEAINAELQTVYSMSALTGLVFHWIEQGFVHTPAYMQEQLLLLLQWTPTTAKTKRQVKR
jgi:AcrR family transcriptional regulator